MVNIARRLRDEIQYVDRPSLRTGLRLNESILNTDEDRARHVGVELLRRIVDVVLKLTRKQDSGRLCFDVRFWY